MGRKTAKATRGSGDAVADRKAANKKQADKAERVVSDDNESVSSEAALQPPVNDAVEDTVNDVVHD